MVQKGIIDEVSRSPRPPSARLTMLIALHLGAHKTATTYIQKALEQSRESLRRTGVGYPPLNRIRSTITGRLDFAGLGLGSAARRILAEYHGCERLILSDENMLGGLRPSRRTKEFYAARSRRVGGIVRNVRPNPVKIFFATRSYDEFVSAMYCEYIRHNPFISAASYLDRIDLEALSWSRVIATLVEIVGAENLTVWRYEDFSLVEDDVFGALTGGPANLVSKPTALLRESLSAEAVETLAGLQSTLTARQIRSRVKPVAMALPKGPNRPPFSAYEQAEAEKLRARYDEEMRQLADRFSALSLLSPSPPHRSSPCTATASRPNSSGDLG